MFKYLLFSIVLLTATCFIFLNKGYLNVSRIVAPDKDVEAYLNAKYANKISILNTKNSGIEEDILDTFSWIRDVKVKISPNLNLNINYEIREIFAICDTPGYFVSTEGVLFLKQGLSVNNVSDYPKFIYNGQKIGENVYSEDEIQYIKKLKIYPRITLSSSNSKSYIKSVGSNWFVEIAALRDSVKTAASTNSLLNDLSSQGKNFSSILVLGDRLVVKD